MTAPLRLRTAPESTNLMPPRSPLTPEQRQAQADAKLARIRHRTRALETGQKIILGGMLLNAARRDPEICRWLLDEAERSVTRDVDRKRLKPLLLELVGICAEAAPRATASPFDAADYIRSQEDADEYLSATLAEGGDEARAHEAIRRAGFAVR